MDFIDIILASQLSNNGTGGGRTVDGAFSTISTNPVENRVITRAIGDTARAIEKTYPVESANGQFVGINDGADGIPVESCVVSFSPVQDLHGQSAPYPAGGGKNKFDNARWSQAENYPNAGDYNYNLTDPIYLTPNTQYAYKPTGSGSIENVSYYNIWVYSGEGVGLSDAHTEYRLINKGTINAGGTFTTGSTGAIRLAVNVSTSYSLEDRLSYIYAATQFQIEEGSSPTDFAPYSNICPISGFDSLTVYKTGKNLISPRIYNGIGYNASVGAVFTPAATDDAWTQGNGKLTYTTTSSYTGMSLMTGLLPAGTYAYRISNLTDDGLRFTKYLLDSEYTVLSKGYTTSLTTSTGTYTLTEPGYIAFHFDNGTSSGAREITAQVEVGDTATEYEAYTGTSITAQLGGTYYGGTVDMVSGEASITYVGVDMGNLTWERSNSSTSYYYFYTELSSKAANYNFISSCYENLRVTRTQLTDNSMGIFNNNNTTSYRRVVIRDDDYTKAADFKASVTGQTLVYQLTTPLTITLTPQELTTLLGNNYIWSNAGSISVTYHADIKKYIDNAVAAAVAALS